MIKCEENTVRLGGKPLFGILGGMGPLSSAELVKTVYTNSQNQIISEQNFPRMVLISDPAIPDRAKSLKDQAQTNEVIQELIEKIDGLIKLGSSEIIIACITAHLYLKLLPLHIQDKVTSMLDLLYKEIETQNGRCLILSSLAVRSNNIINHSRVQYLADEDAEMIQEYIFKIKLGGSDKLYAELMGNIVKIAPKYKVTTVIFACTELHMLKVWLKSSNISLQFNIIDSLELLANYIIKKQI